jgi:hypothetical protein
VRDCGSKNPYLVDYMGDGRMVCEHRYACEARQMLADEAAAHAQQRRPCTTVLVAVAALGWWRAVAAWRARHR